jgi:diadenosine tetraphosphatase ApaH/serine/threonine PP2A family protein phosphatase
MRVLVISDIHANLTALQAVLNDAKDIEATWCLGDLVGYGPDPNECIAAIRALPNLLCIIGNHDAAVLDHIDPSTFNPEARNAIDWTQNRLTDDSVAFLKSLPEKIDVQQVTLAHGSPRQPVWEYLLDTHNATRSFEFFDTSYCFVGHTHLPILYYLPNGYHLARLLLMEPNTRTQLSPRAIINPGSVGQPRDRDPRAAYAIYNTDAQTWEYRRVAYDIPAVQSRMQTFKLPERHIQRLAAGW